jgi:hypothetical protein
LRRGWRPEAQPKPKSGLKVSQTVALREARQQAMLDVVVHEEESHLIQAAAGGHELRQYVLAHAILGQHAVDAPDLALDAAQPGEEGFRVRSDFLRHIASLLC